MPRRRPTPETGPSGAGDGAQGAAQGTGWSPRDMLIPYVLLAVSLQRAHGYLIEEYLKGLGFFGIEMSTLYRTLRSLEKDGLLDSAWEPGPTGPARRVYALTDLGKSWLATWAGTLQIYRGMIDRFFGLYGGVFPGFSPRPEAQEPRDAKDKTDPPPKVPAADAPPKKAARPKATGKPGARTPRSTTASRLRPTTAAPRRRPRSRLDP